MLKNIYNEINKSKKTTAGLFLIIFLIGIFLRVYQYHDWLFFKWDQARDAMIISEAIENGPNYLPLLGPRATKVGDDYLRLGPAFYYSQYVFGAMFNSTAPEVFALPDTFFAILTIPLLFLFLRLYFNRVNSLLGTTLYAFSFLVVQYSRFAWNPNSVPFFMLLTFYGMLMTLRSSECRKKLLWLLVWMSSVAIVTQYHFFAFFGLIAIMAAYFFFYLEPWKIRGFLIKLKGIFNKKTIGYVLVSLFVFLFIYTPVIISDMKTDGSNVKNFVGAFVEKPRDDKNFGEKLIRNFREQGKNYNLIATSFWTREGKKADPYPVGFGLFLMISGIVLSLWQRNKTNNENKRDFLLLMPVWIIMFFLITISVSYQLRPRYFVPVFPVPFIVLVLWFSFLRKKIAKGGLAFVLVIFSAFLLMNFYGIAAWFKDQHISQQRSFSVDRDFILKKQDGVTLGQLERAVDYIHKNFEGTRVAFYSKAEYKQPIIYLVSQIKPNRLKEEADHIGSARDLVGYSELFVVGTVKGGVKSIPKDIEACVEIVLSEEFGQVMVFKMKIDQNKVSEFIKNSENKGGKEDLKENNEASSEEEDEVEVEDGKTERLLWKDVF